MDKEKKIINAPTCTKRKHADFLLNLSGGTLNALHKTKGEDFWIKKGEAKALSLFHKMSKRVPAYRKFLKQHKVNPGLIRSIKDFENVPLTDKKNYIERFPLDERAWDGNLKNTKIIAVSSGTTGHPTIWPRGVYQEEEAVTIHELLYSELYGVGLKSTLLVIGFPMGAYVSGIATAIPSLSIAKKVHNLTVLTVGNKKDELLGILQEMYSKYEQIILAGHPFFIKDIIETGRKNKAPWLKKNIKMFFCSEGFSERWRQYITKKAYAKALGDAFSVYGSSELLLMATETPLTVLLRQTIATKLSLSKILFGSVNVPQLFQYNPFLRYAEEIDGELVFTAECGIPLVRYNLHDKGKVLLLSEVLAQITDIFPLWRKILQKNVTKKIWNLPLLTLEGRSDVSLVVYAANIYPEHIKQALDQKQFLSLLTGKFTMRKEYLKNMDQYWEINIELRECVSSSVKLQKRLRERLITTLKKVNMEYRFIWEHLDKDVRPRVTLWPHQSTPYFLQGVKPKYIIS